jgi:hypothetical protein
MSAFEKTMDSVNVALQKFNGPYFLGSQVLRFLATFLSASNFNLDL